MNSTKTYNYVVNHLIRRPVSIAPLITFRILFGGLMMVGAVRFMLNGWVERLYVEPEFFFKFYGFEWVEPLGQTGMYLVYALIAISAAMVMLGLFYRLAIVLFFLSFIYTELIDATNYLNHYYLVGLLAFLMIFLPANQAFSLDTWRNSRLNLSKIPAWSINVLILQISIVYFCAGFAKLNADWLLRAMPLAVWLPAKAHFPVLGPVFAHSWTPYLFSWFGAFYDLTIAFFLLYKPTRPFAYVAVLVFHILTKLLFNIGLFPFIMIFSTLIFFSGAFHEQLLGYLGYKPQPATSLEPEKNVQIFSSALSSKGKVAFFSIFLMIQFLLPFRHFLYSGNVLWTEEAYRFSWRVMLVEKAGQATFYVTDPKTGRKGEVINSEYLTSYQEKQMAIQPDFILQFAHFLKEEYQEKFNIQNPVITVESYVALNGRASKRFIDPKVNLAVIRDGFYKKPWILPFRENENTLSLKANK